jgi:hypothetical protein
LGNKRALFCLLYDLEQFAKSLRCSSIGAIESRTVAGSLGAQWYREEALRLREKAAHAATHEVRTDLGAIARQYELLAESMEHSYWLGPKAKPEPQHEK